MSYEIDIDAWFAEAERRYGQDRRRWRFRCPACAAEASLRDFPEGAQPSDAALRCVASPQAHTVVGRKVEPEVFIELDTGDLMPVFDFADEPLIRQSLQ